MYFIVFPHYLKYKHDVDNCAWAAAFQLAAKID